MPTATNLPRRDARVKLALVLVNAAAARFVKLALLLGATGVRTAAAAPVEAEAAAETTVRIGIAVPPLVGTAPPEWNTRLTRGLAAGMHSAKFDPVSVEPSCSDPACWMQQARDNDIPGILLVKIGFAGNDYQWSLAFIDGATGAATPLDTQTCEVCTVDEASTAIARGIAASRFEVRRRITAPNRVTVTSEPTGAVLFVGGVYVGTTPFEFALPKGDVRILAKKIGYEPAVREIRDAAPRESAIHLQLLPLPQRDPEPHHSKLWPVIGGSAIALGALGVISGSILVGLEGRPYRRRCAGADVDADGDCRFVYKTLPVGAALLGTGLTFAVGGTLAVVLSARARRRARRSAP